MGGGYCRLQMPLRLALGVRGTVAGHRLGPHPLPMHLWHWVMAHAALEGSGGGGCSPPFGGTDSPAVGLPSVPNVVAPATGHRRPTALSPDTGHATCCPPLFRGDGTAPAGRTPGGGGEGWHKASVFGCLRRRAWARARAPRPVTGITGWGWHKASVSDCVPLAAPMCLSPLLILTLCGPERVLVVSTEPPDDLSCLTTPGVGRPGDGAVAHAVDQVHPEAHSESEPRETPGSNPGAVTTPRGSGAGAGGACGANEARGGLGHPLTDEGSAVPERRMAIAWHCTALPDLCRHRSSLWGVAVGGRRWVGRRGGQPWGSRAKLDQAIAEAPPPDRGGGVRGPARPQPTPCVTFRPVVAPLRGPGQSPALPFACCVGSLRSVGRCGRCSRWCRFRVRGAQ